MARLEDTSKTIRAEWASSAPPLFERPPQPLAGPAETALIARATGFPEPRMATLNPDSDLVTPPPRRDHLMPHPDVLAEPAAPVRHGPPLVQSDETMLSVRGKGQHVCPHGLACTKGGVGSDGLPIVFERNSAFR